MKQGRHLDLGCGKHPQNPYLYTEVYGIDIVKHPDIPAQVEFKQVNLSVEPIPFPDGYFDSLSAFDFIEHVPRVLSMTSGSTRAPFLELMDEVWRVLKPGGLFYALTPAYPRPEAFQDPTHVNFITAKTHDYFCGKRPYAANYGFKGKFAAVRAEWIHGENAITADCSWQKSCKGWYRTLCGHKKFYLLWELKAVK